MEQKNEKKSVWGVLLKVIIAVASAIAGASCTEPNPVGAVYLARVLRRNTLKSIF